MGAFLSGEDGEGWVHAGMPIHSVRWGCESINGPEVPPQRGPLMLSPGGINLVNFRSVRGRLRAGTFRPGLLGQVSRYRAVIPEDI